MRPTEPCPNIDTLVEYAEGRTPTNQRSALEDHLDDCDACRACIAVAAQTTPTADASTEVLLSERFAVGLRLGEGGMGVVYEAYDRRLEMWVALKMVRPDLPSAARNRLEREARFARAVRHPHVCAVFDVGEADGTPYLVMERLDGEPLSDWLRRNPPAASAQRLTMVHHIAEALAAAHARGVLHRDLKPSNVFVCADGTVKVLDFGLAAQTDMVRGGGVGTPKWWSPEQGRGEPATPRSDVYALGRVAAAIFLGALPRRQRRWGMRCTAPDPSKRFASAAAASAALARSRRARWPGIALLLLVALLIAGIYNAQPIRYDAVAVMPFDSAADVAGLDGLLATALGESRGLRVVPPWVLPTDDGEPQAVRRWCRKNEVQAYITGAVKPRAGALQLQLTVVDVKQGATFTLEADATSPAGLPGVIDDVADALLARIGRPPIAEERRVGATVGLAALQRYTQGQQHLARHDSTQAILQFREAFAADPDFASAGLWLAVARDWVGDRVGARTALNETLLLAHRLPERERHLLLALHAKLENDVPTALDQLDGLLARFPDETYARFLRGDIAYHAGLYDIAVERLRDLLDHDAEHDLARHHWLWALHMSGRSKQARQAAANWRMTNQTAAAFVIDVELSLVGGDHDAARQIAAQGAARFPHDARLSMIAPILDAQNDWAIAPLNEQLPNHSTSRVLKTEVRRQLAWIHAYRGAFEDADAVYAALIAELDARGESLSESQRRTRTYFRAEWAWLLALRPHTQPQARQLIRQHLLESKRLRLKPVAQYVGLSCWALRDWACLERAAASGWPLVVGLASAFRSWRIEGAQTARRQLSALIEQTEVYYSDALKMLHVELSVALGDRASARQELEAWSRLRFARPQHMFLHPFADCYSAALELSTSAASHASSGLCSLSSSAADRGAR